MISYADVDGKESEDLFLRSRHNERIKTRFSLLQKYGSLTIVLASLPMALSFVGFSLSYETKLILSTISYTVFTIVVMVTFTLMTVALIKFIRIVS